MTDTPERYDPPEEKIVEIVGKFTPRQLAIAYLRARKRARDAETAFGVMGDINDMTLGAFSGRNDKVNKASERAKRRLRTHKGFS